MLWKNAEKLLAQHADGGKVERVGENQLDCTVNGKRFSVVRWGGGRGEREVVGAVYVRTPNADGGSQRPEDWDTTYSGNNLRDGLRAALQRSRETWFDYLGQRCRLLVDLTHEGLGLTPRPCFMLGGTLVSTLADERALAAAEAFIDGGPAEPLVDWLVEHSEQAARWCEEVKGVARLREQVAEGKARRGRGKGR